MFCEKKGLKKLLLLQALIGGGSPAVERIALGNPLTFGTDLARPLVSLEIPFTPQQEGTGDPSPSNVRNIVPWNGLNVFHAGRNLLQKTNYAGGFYVSNDGTDLKNTSSYITVVEGDDEISVTSTIGWYGCVFATPVLPVGSYKVKLTTNDSNFRGAIYKTDEDLITKGTGTQYSASINATVTLSEPSRIALYMGMMNSGTINLSDVQIEVGTVATDYENPIAPTDTDIVFPSPVYGGTLDVVSGVLADGWNDKTVAEIRFDKKADHIFQGYFSDRKYGVGVFSIISDKYKTITAVASTGSTIESLYAQYGDGIYINSGSGTFYICDSNYTDVDAFQTAMADTVVVYELATPTEQTLTGHQITALIGNNTIWSDADGSMTAVYFVSSKYADEHPVGGLGFGFGFGSGSSDPDEPDEPDDPENPDEPEEPIIDDSENNQIEGEEP